MDKENNSEAASGEGDQQKKMPPMASPDETTKMTDDATKVKFTNANSFRVDETRNGDAKVDIENIQVAFAGMGKEELMKFANDPFWIRLRWTLFILFWLGWLSMLVGAIVIIVQAPRCPPLPQLQWWQKSVVYQIYPRSFQDSDGDGIGDLQGIESRVDYLADIGVKSVWLSPIYKSPMEDFGYDIEDYKAIDPIFGTLQDFNALVDKLNSKGIKLIMDFVPNHTSNKNEWFEKSRERQEPYTDYYVWANGNGSDDKGNAIVPNNWTSVFGGSAWTFDDKRKQFYLHQFLPDQPDLNLRNDLVKQELLDVLTFWMDLGVRGFRADAVSHLYEDINLNDEPVARLNKTNNTLQGDYAYFDHIYTKGQPENLDLIREWRNHIDDYADRNETGPILLMVESMDRIEDVMKFYGNETAKIANFPFNFDLVNKLNEESTAVDVLALIRGWLFNMPLGAWPNWVLGNHDQSRIASRVNPNLVDGLHMITMLMTGTPVTYYGEEIGMENIKVTFQDTQDPQGLRAGEDNYLTMSRDPERSPMQWNNESNAGFTNASTKPWLAINPNYLTGINVQAQLVDAQSHLKVYKRLIELRSEPAIMYGSVGFLDIVENVFGFSRVKKGSPGYLVLVNFGENATTINLSKQPEVKPTNYVSLKAEPDVAYKFPDGGNVEMCSINVPTTSRLNPRSSTKGKVQLGDLLLGPKESVLIKFVPTFPN